jgi:hypothetical protein
VRHGDLPCPLNDGPCRVLTTVVSGGQVILCADGVAGTLRARLGRVLERTGRWCQVDAGSVVRRAALELRPRQ